MKTYILVVGLAIALGCNPRPAIGIMTAEDVVDRLAFSWDHYVQVPVRMASWEYRIEFFEQHEAIQKVNELARFGWEVVTFRRVLHRTESNGRITTSQGAEVFLRRFIARTLEGPTVPYIENLPFNNRQGTVPL